MSAFEDQSGKIGAALFKEDLLPYCGAQRPEVLTGPQFGVDSAVIDLGNGQALATSSDPLSLIPGLALEVSAWLSVHLLANDMATTGHAPQFAQFVLNLPPSLSRNDFGEYWQHIHRYCQQIGVAITGGHTGQAEGQNSTISGGGTMFLTAPTQTILTSNKARPGDVLIATKEAAITSTSLMAMSFPQTVKNKLGEEVWKNATESFYSSSVLKEALLAAKTLKPLQELRALHDVTEGGVLGAVYEMAQASNCGFVAHSDAISISPAAHAIANFFAFDPLYSVGAGSMIMAVKPGTENRLIAALQAEGISASVIGHFNSKSEGYHLVEKGEEKPFTFSGKDPYWAAFFKAFKANLS